MNLWFVGLLFVLCVDLIVCVMLCCLLFGYVLFWCGDLLCGLYVVLVGLFMIGVVDLYGKEVLLMVVEFVMWFGEIVLFDG